MHSSADMLVDVALVIINKTTVQILTSDPLDQKSDGEFSTMQMD